MSHRSSLLPLVVAPLALAFVALAACASDPAPPPAPVTLSLANLCTELAKADCDRLESCGLLAAPFDRDGCLLRQAELLCTPVQAAFARSVAAGELTFLELAAKACRDHVAQLGCARGPDVWWFGEPECGSLVAGAVAEGGACSLPGACTSGLYCYSGGTCPGTCQALGGNNQECSGTEPCADGFFCVTPGMRCRARVALGAPCELSVAGNSCVDGAFCDASQPGGATCAPARGARNGCTSSYECASGLTCIANLCSGGQERDTCASDYDCQGLLRCTGGRCGAVLAASASCDGRVPCGEGLTCTSSAGAMVCAARPGLGDPCTTSGAPCWFGRCVNSTCTALVGDGGGCALPEDCLPGRDCTNGHCDPGVPFCGE